ncbi:MAG: flagellar protein FlgN [Lachnospiraceae bacterium]|nr:flagellar protein FlgN [Lachnospiraceae bacterium]
MAGLMDELIMTLNDELQIYKDLIPISDTKSGVIISNNVAELERITEKEQIIAENLGRLEKKRERIMADIRTVLSKRNSELKLDELIGLMEKQPESQKQLIAVRKELKETIGRLKMLNDRNQKLITESLSISEYQLNMIRSAKSYIGNNYTRSAGQFNMACAGAFDARQ